jgi:hypothetical protein
MKCVVIVREVSVVRGKFFVNILNLLGLALYVYIRGTGAGIKLSPGI